MATFSNLFFAGDALRRAITARVQQGGVPPVLVSPPPVAAGTTPRVTITLLMVNEEPAHKNDPSARNPDGSTSAAPTSLSATYLVTTEGQTAQGNAADAHQYLGEVLRLFHDTPRLELAALGFLPTQGEGRLHVALVPLTPDLVEKVFTPLQAAHRPFALFEVWPIQLRSTLPDGQPTAVVRPGGVALVGPSPVARPVIQRVYPRRVGLDRFLRIDGAFTKPVSAVVIGSRTLSGAALATVPGRSLTEAVRVHVDPVTFSGGVQSVHVLTEGNLASNDEEILIEPATIPALDAPNVVSHSAAGPDLILTGAGLAQASFVHLWPDAGVAHPSDVRSLPVAAASAGQVTVSLAGVPPGVYRVAVELPSVGAPSWFTAFVVLEVRS